MYYPTKTIVIAFLVASLSGVALHFVYDWFPSVVTALVAPVSESLWEHAKLIFFPGLVAAVVLSWGRGGALGAWLFAVVAACIAMLTVAYLFHIILDFHSLPFDIALYFASMVFLFWLAPRLGETFQGGLWLVPPVMAVIFALMLVVFTFSPPEGPLFREHAASAYTMCGHG